MAREYSDEELEKILDKAYKWGVKFSKSKWGAPLWLDRLG